MQVTWLYTKPTQLTWIDEHPDDRSRKENQSSLRAHAARIAHQRRRLRQVAEHNSKSVSPPSQTSTPSSDESITSRGRLVLPRPSVWRGNSDPFDSLALPIGPGEAQAIEFLRLVWIPRTHASSPMTGLTKESDESFQHQALQDYVVTLGNDTFGKAFLLPFMVILQQLVQRQDLEIRIAALKLHILQRIKKSLATLKTNDVRTMYLLQSLLLASVAERRLWETEAHTTAMRTALLARFESRGGLSPVCGDCPNLGDESMKDRQVSDDVLLDALAPKWLSMFTSPSSIISSNNLSAFCRWESDPMRKFGIDIRHCLWMWHMARVTSPELLLNRQFASMIWMGIYDYLKEIETLVQLDHFQEHGTPDSKAHWHTQACMALGLLCHLRSNAIIEMPQPEIPAWLIHRLQMYLSRAIDFTEQAGPDYVRKHENVFLFSLWYAAVLERGVPDLARALSRMSIQATTWSQQQFAATARERGFTTWENVYEELTAFAPYIVFPVSGERWVVDALKSEEHREGYRISGFLSQESWCSESAVAPGRGLESSFQS